MYRYLLSLIKIPDLSEDLVQDIFIRIWDARQRLEIKQQFRSYIFRVCHNQAIDMNREVASRQHLLDQLEYHYQVMPALESYSEQELQRYDTLVEEALGTLTPQRRKVYELCRKEKKSYEEVARELGISINTVKTHVSKTLSLLRSYIKDSLIRKNMSISLIALLLQKFF